MACHTRTTLPRSASASNRPPGATATAVASPAESSRNTSREDSRSLIHTAFGVASATATKRPSGDTAGPAAKRPSERCMKRNSPSAPRARSCSASPRRSTSSSTSSVAKPSRRSPASTSTLASGVADAMSQVCKRPRASGLRGRAATTVPSGESATRTAELRVGGGNSRGFSGRSTTRWPGADDTCRVQPSKKPSLPSAPFSISRSQVPRACSPRIARSSGARDSSKANRFPSAVPAAVGSNAARPDGAVSTTRRSSGRGWSSSNSTPTRATRPPASRLKRRRTVTNSSASNSS